MTLIYGFDLDILKMYLRTKNEAAGLRLSKVRARQTDKHTDRRDRTHYHAAYAVVKIEQEIGTP